MHSRIFVRPVVGTMAASALNASDQELLESLVGSWSLVSFEHVLPSGELSKPFGDSPSGLILYQADGHMSAQVSAGNPAKFTSDDPSQASAEEATAAWRTYFGYWGTFKIDKEKRVVVHRVAGASFSNWIGTEQVRDFRFDEANRLILETQLASGHFTLIWQKRVS